MKPITEKKRVTLPDAWGRDSTTDRQRFEVESSDVGTRRADYLGQGHRTYQFTTSDVGREIEVMTSPGYHCWSFVS